MRAGNTHESAREKDRKGTAKPMCLQEGVENDGSYLTILSGSTSKLEHLGAWKSPKKRSAVPLTSVTNHRPSRQNRQARQSRASHNLQTDRMLSEQHMRTTAPLAQRVELLQKGAAILKAIRTIVHVCLRVMFR